MTENVDKKKKITILDNIKAKSSEDTQETQEDKEIIKKIIRKTELKNEENDSDNMNMQNLIQTEEQKTEIEENEENKKSKNNNEENEDIENYIVDDELLNYVKSIENNSEELVAKALYNEFLNLLDKKIENFCYEMANQVREKSDTQKQIVEFSLKEIPEYENVCEIDFNKLRVEIVNSDNIFIPVIKLYENLAKKNGLFLLKSYLEKIREKDLYNKKAYIEDIFEIDILKS